MGADSFDLNVIDLSNPWKIGAQTSILFLIKGDEIFWIYPKSETVVGKQKVSCDAFGFLATRGPSLFSKRNPKTAI